MGKYFKLWFYECFRDTLTDCNAHRYLSNGRHFGNECGHLIVGPILRVFVCIYSKCFSLDTVASILSTRAYATLLEDVYWLLAMLIVAQRYISWERTYTVNANQRRLLQMQSPCDKINNINLRNKNDCFSQLRNARSDKRNKKKRENKMEW